MRFQTHEEIDEHYKNLGYPVDEWKSEEDLMRRCFEISEKLHRKKYGWFKMIFHKPKNFKKEVRDVAIKTFEIALQKKEEIKK